MTIRMIIFLVLTVFHRVLSQKIPVENTTCLELAKPSNQHLRLICSQNDYHCLLDETFTKEFEVCTEWRWILGGKCAYFNTYGSGNIDERNCIQKPNLTCSTVQFSSASNTNHTACYAKKEISTSPPSTTSPTRTQAVEGTRSVTETSDKGNATNIKTTSDKHCQRHPLPIILGIVAPLVSLAVVYFIFMHLKYVPLYRKALRCTERARNEDFVEQQLFFRIEKEDTLESPTTMRDEDENINDTRRSGNSDANDPAAMNESDNLSEHFDFFDDVTSSPTIIKQKNSIVSTEKHQKGDKDELRTVVVDLDACKSAEADISKDLNEGVSIADVQRKKLDEENSAANAPGVCIDSDKSDNEEGDTQELTDVFDDTMESIQRIAHPTEEQDRELCTKLYNLLEIEGLKLTQEVMAATLTRETEKSVETLINSLTDQEKNKLKEMLPEESRRILESKTGLDNSIHVSYGLHRIILDEEKSPKSGWGNPVRGTDIGIGDDIERLNRIQTIVQKIPNPVTVSVESYIRLFDIMIKALTRLDPDAEFKEDYKLLCCKLESIKNPDLTQTMLKTITNAVKKIW